MKIRDIFCAIGLVALPFILWGCFNSPANQAPQIVDRAAMHGPDTCPTTYELASKFAQHLNHELGSKVAPQWLPNTVAVSSSAIIAHLNITGDPALLAALAKAFNQQRWKDDFCLADTRAEGNNLALDFLLEPTYPTAQTIRHQPSCPPNTTVEECFNFNHDMAVNRLGGERQFPAQEGGPSSPQWAKFSHEEY